MGAGDFDVQHGLYVPVQKKKTGRDYAPFFALTSDVPELYYEFLIPCICYERG